MASNSVQSKRRFGPFLLKKLQSGTCEGISWLKREEKIFTISWADNRSRSSRVNPLFKDWQVYNNRYKEGDEEDRAAWKQTFKSALARCPDVMRVEGMCDKKDLIRVYKFGDAVTVRDDGVFYLGKVISVTSQEITEPESSQSPMDASLEALNYNDTMEYNNIPNIVREEFYTGNSGVDDHMNNTIPEMMNNVTYNCPSPMQTSRAFEGWRDSQQQADGNTQNNNQSTYTIDSDDWKEFFPSNSSMDFGSGEISDIAHLVSDVEDKPVLKYQIYYNHSPVLKGCMKNSSSGIRLFHGFTSNAVNIELDQVIGPRDFDEHELPTLRDDIFHSKKEEVVANIRKILDGMNRGLLLWPRDAQLHCLRLCSPRVFSWNNMDGTTYLNRRSKACQVLFDMNQFSTALQAYKHDPENNSCPNPTVTLTFGQKYTKHDFIQKKFLMHVDVTLVQAEELLNQEIPSRQDPQFSGFDSGDQLLHLLRTKLCV